MIKVGTLILDVYDDTEGLIARRLPAELQETLKVASPDDVQELADHEFALVIKTAAGQVLRRLPVHDAEALKTSSAYWAQVHASLPPVVRDVAEAKLAAASAWLSGNADAERAHRTVAYIDAATLEAGKVAAPASTCWGLTLEGRNVFPLHTAEHVKVAVARFPFNIEGLTPDTRFAYARALEKRAAALGVEVPADSRINNYTGTEINLTSLAVAIDKRKHAAAKAGVSAAFLEQLNELAGCALPRGDAESDVAFLHRQAKQARVEKLDAAMIVSHLGAFDKLAGFGNREYLRGLPDPFAAVFTKAAAGPALIDGVDLTQIPADKLAQAFDEEFVKEFMANPAAVYQSLPTPVKQRLRQMAGEQRQVDNKPKSPSFSGGDPMSMLNPVYANGSPASN